LEIDFPKKDKTGCFEVKQGSRVNINLRFIVGQLSFILPKTS